MKVVASTESELLWPITSAGDVRSKTSSASGVSGLGRGDAADETDRDFERWGRTGPRSRQSAVATLSGRRPPFVCTLIARRAPAATSHR